jgi:ubiquinone/menaquinone biosynthesis C-methylase UbiE
VEIDAERVRDQAREQWSHDPAGAFVVGGELGSPESFQAVEQYRYREQPWMHDTFRFERFAGKRVLEIGVGLGTDLLQFARAGAQTTGIDLTPTSIDMTRRRFDQEGLSADLRVMDAERLEFPDASFDAVYSFGVLHHVASTEVAVAEVRRVLHPTGQFLGALYSRQSFYYLRVRLQRVRSGRFRTESLGESLARIERSTTDAQPLVRLFSKRDVMRLLRDAGFSHAKVHRRHAGLGRHTERFPPWIERLLGSVGGWYLVFEAQG